MYISCRSGTKGLQILPCLNYYNVLKRESRFALELNAAKNMDYMKKTSNKHCWELNFLQKAQWVHMSTCPRS